MVLVDKENVKGYVQMDEKEHAKKEYASKGLAGTALGLGIGGLAVSLLNNGCNPLGIFGRNCGTNAGEVAIAANEQYLERKQCADFVELLAKDETYISIERELQLMIQEELINSVKDKVAASPRGKELLEKQLNNIKVKKEEIIKEANKNIEVFKRFQEAARVNPNLTYAEFVKSLN